MLIGMGQQEKLQEMLAALWEQHRDTIFERVDLIAAACRSLQNGSLQPDQWEEARSAAHKLAGVLGTFGRKQGTDLARSIENWPINERGLPQDSQRLQTEIEALRASLL